MSEIQFESLVHFEEVGEGFNCLIEDNKLESLEKILSIVKRKNSNLNSFDFFEFGSSHYSLSSYGVRSGKRSHFMGVGTGLNYKCFDAYNEANDFDAFRRVIESYKSAPKVRREEYASGDKEFKIACKNFKSLDKKKDLDDTFVSIKNREYYGKCCELYGKIDLDDLKDKIDNFAVRDYEKMIELIDSSQNPIIFSQNVLNAPNLSREFPFWEINNAVQIHCGSIREFFEILKFNHFDYKHRNLFNKELFLENFKKKYNLEEEVDVDFERDEDSFYFFWSSKINNFFHASFSR